MLETPKQVTKAVLRELTTVDEPWCVSLLMPTHRAQPENRQDPIRLKNLLRRAEEMLVEQGVRSADARDVLAPAASLVSDSLFWSRQDWGLALYFWPQGFQQLHIPAELQERVVVDDRAWIVPLLPLVTDDARFFVLALSGETVRLLEASRYTASERPLPEAPRDFEDLARFIEEEKQLQFHTRAAPAGEAGDRAAVFHGHGGGAEKSVRKTRLREYCQWIDKALARALAGESGPLVLAADEPLMAIFREVGSYRHLFAEGVPGNPDHVRPDQLRDRAWKLVEGRLKQSHRRAVEAYRQAAAHGGGTERLEDVLWAGSQGRIATLLVDRTAERWGRFDGQVGTVELHAQPKPGDHELVNQAAAMALGQSAEVFAWPPDEMPTREPVAAVLRY